ncbi:DEAD/DEAH box helicase (plasmid) [Bradyrhizobium barranii subsp. barranii]|uniref:DEAD/DEAH box helicase n=1 Tax=Bradyrhizobium barranii subsp. barranii TaxID=2823807 RepID=A0A7Z0QQ53_9BRAD|nr:helicase-related protein [Bradyrhizobium barranii]UGX89716.1 DEAD/DEAH box helicase [Bradyrhizobium barranii subsp. barranii]
MGRLNPKQFQLDTIEHVYRKLSRSQSRFLVADEVGLGKTIIARGVIQKFQQNLKARNSREPNNSQELVLYVCSSSDIGKQNIKKLMFEGGEALGDGRASRLTMLFCDQAQSALKAARESGNGRSTGMESDRRYSKLEVVCLTPATSFDFGFPEGKKEERQFLHALLSAAFQERGLKDDLLRKAATSFFTRPAQTDHWGWRSAVKQKLDNEVAWILENRPGVAECLLHRLDQPFLDAAFDFEKSADREVYWKLKIDKRTSILDVFKLALDECDGFLDRKSEWAEQLRALRRIIIRRLREQLALVVVFTLQPHLVILDEFQNFSELLASNPAPGRGTNHIVRTLFDKDARLLLLSATPYKAATADFEAAENSHYRKFWDTIEFLLRFHPNGKELLASIGSNFNLYRKSIQNLREAGDPQFNEAKSCKRKIESELREVMVRTERFRYLDDPANGVKEPEVEPWVDTATSESGELSAPLPGVELQNQDVHYLAWLKKAFRPEQQMFLPEIWASIPYALNLMPKTYKMIGSLYTTGDGLSDCLRTAVRTADAEKYCPTLAEMPLQVLDSAAPNPKLRELIRQLKSEEIYHHLWVCPTKAYYSVDGSGRGPRKRLIFSRWQAVPQAVSILTSLYADEMLGANDESHGDTLKLSYNSVELAPILFHPSLWLAEAGLAIYSKKTCGRASLDVLEQSVAAQLEKELKARRIRVTDGRLDSLETIAAVLHRMEPRSYSELYRNSIDSKFRYWPQTKRATDDDDDADPESSVKSAIEAFHGTSQEEAKKVAKAISRASLKFLTQIALAGPGISLLRVCLQFGLLRFGEGAKVNAAGDCEPEKIFSAVLRTAHGPIRRFFNHSHAGLVIRKLDLKGKPTHLERTAKFCARNHLSAVMDELAFLMDEDLPPFEKRPGDRAVELIENLGSSFRIAVGKPVFREVHGKDRLRAHNRSVSRHIAQAFVDERGVKDDSGKDLLRDQIRRAFNSPFWPFVLVTTSIGQEGLDFHRYCSDVVHWNLPHSPAAFEQREGRIQRYLGKAIRDAWVRDRSWDEFLSTGLRSGSSSTSLSNPWTLILRLLETEETECNVDRRGLSPQWIYERDGEFAHIHRWIFCHPFSRESVAYRRMRDSVLLYRLALGQARQDDLIRALSQQPAFRDSDLKDRRQLVRDLWIDLSPPRLRPRFVQGQ